MQAVFFKCPLLDQLKGSSCMPLSAVLFFCDQNADSCTQVIGVQVVQIDVPNGARRPGLFDDVPELSGCKKVIRSVLNISFQQRSGIRPMWIGRCHEFRIILPTQQEVQIFLLNRAQSSEVAFAHPLSNRPENTCAVGPHKVTEPKPFSVLRKSTLSTPPGAFNVTGPFSHPF